MLVTEPLHGCMTIGGCTESLIVTQRGSFSRSSLFKFNESLGTHMFGDKELEGVLAVIGITENLGTIGE